MLPFRPSPLVDVGMSYVAATGKELRPEESAHIRDVLTRYLAGFMSSHECRSILFPIIGTCLPIETLDSILCTSQVPAPPPSTSNTAAPARSRESRARARLWAPYEDQRLLAAIHRYGLDNWQLVAAFVGNGRTKAQCSQRWFRGLDPRISKAHWMPEQDDRLLELVAVCGDRCWSRIASEFGDRCDVQCRYRYKQLEKEQGFAERLCAARAKAQQLSLRPPKENVRVKPSDHLLIQTAAFWRYPVSFSIPPIPAGYYPTAAPVCVPSVPPPPAEVPEPPPAKTPPTLTSHPSSFDWANTFGVSPSGSFLGSLSISPMNSLGGFKFEP
jgi:hypothetical protein